MPPRDIFKVPKVQATQTLVPDVTLYYDYNRVSSEARGRVQEIAVAIKRARTRVQGEMLDIATNLLEVRESNVFPENEWQDWVLTEFGIEPRTAQLMMNVARTYKERVDAPKLLAMMGDTVAVMLSQPSVPEKVRTEVEHRLQEKPLPTRKVKEMIRDLTHKEAVEVVGKVLDALDPQTEQRILNSNTSELKKELPDDVTLSDGVLQGALMSLRSERLAKLVPPDAGEGIERDLPTAHPKDKEMPLELVRAGWELRRLDSNGEYFCVNDLRNVATKTYYAWRSAINQAEGMEVAFRAKANEEEENPPEVVEIVLPVVLVNKLLAATVGRLPGMSEKEMQQFRASLKHALL